LEMTSLVILKSIRQRIKIRQRHHFTVCALLSPWTVAPEERSRIARAKLEWGTRFQSRFD